MKLLNKLKKLLKKDERLLSDNDLLKNKIVELALKLGEDLIKLLNFKKVDNVSFFVGKRCIHD